MNKNESTLVILTPGFPENEADTNCLPMQQAFLKAIKDQYPKLDIIVLSFQYPYFKKRYEWFGMTVFTYGGRNRGGLSKLLLRKKLLSALKELQRTRNIIGLLSFWYGECALVGSKFARNNKLKHYCWLLGQDARKENKYPHRVQLASPELIALSDFLQNEFEKNHGTRPAHMIPPLVEAGNFNPGTIQKDIDVLGAGSLIALKQYDIFLEIIAVIRKTMPGIKAILVGDGPERDNLISLAESLELQDTVKMAGELPHGQLLKLMEKTRVFLHPSSYEGFGVVCLEALAASARVVSFVRPIGQDIKNWYITRTKEEMAAKALDILQHREISYESVTVFEKNDIVKQMVDLFLE